MRLLDVAKSAWRDETLDETSDEARNEIRIAIPNQTRTETQSETRKKTRHTTIIRFMTIKLTKTSTAFSAEQSVWWSL